MIKVREVASEDYQDYLNWINSIDAKIPFGLTSVEAYYQQKGIKKLSDFGGK